VSGNVSAATRGRPLLARPEDEARMLSGVIDAISASPDLDEIVQRVAGLITEATATDICFVHLLDQDGRILRMRGATPPFDLLIGKVELALGEGVSGWVAAHREPAVIPADKRSDPRYRYIPELRGEEFTSMASVPITTRMDQVVGVINVHTRAARLFTEADVDLLLSIAGLIAGAIESAQLHRRLAEREAALERFAERMVELQELERRRLGAEIHDGISQRIVSLRFRLSAAGDALPDRPELAARQIAAAQELAGAALEETRVAIAGLRPTVLDDLGLVASLESMARAVEDVQVEADVSPCDLPDHLETAVYRIAQEALTNAVRHAEAQQVHVRLFQSADGVLLQVRDDGRGFDVAAQAEADPRVGGGYGLAGMRERAELVGGRLAVRSTPGVGTTIELLLPRSVVGST
jgi:two-component system, NarL family, sensor kinase